MAEISQSGYNTHEAIKALLPLARPPIDAKQRVSFTRPSANNGLPCFCSNLPHHKAERTPHIALWPTALSVGVNACSTVGNRLAIPLRAQSDCQ